MKKTVIAGTILAAMLFVGVTAFGQRERRLVGFQANQGELDSAENSLEPQIGGGRKQFPGKRGALVNPQLGGRNGRRNPNRPGRQVQRQELMEALGLTSDQRTKMAEIDRARGDEAVAIGRRIRQARNRLDRAIMNPKYDEALVRSYTEELAAAQAEQVRFRSRMRAEMRAVLTSEQLTRLQRLEQERRRLNRQERRNASNEPDEDDDEAAPPPAPPRRRP